MSDVITYRLYAEEDLPKMLSLWESESGWGAITEEQWRKWYLKTPHGESLVVVGIDEGGEIAAQEVFTPTLVDVDGREVRALRLSAPILRRDLRGMIRRADHPMIGLYLAAAEAAIAQGYSFIYALPEHAWLPFFRWLPRGGFWHIANAEYGCVALPLNGNLDSSDEGAASRFHASTASGFGDDYEELWRTAKESFPINCAVVRSPRWLSWKTGAHVRIELRDLHDQSLAGYAAVKKGSGLLVDLLVRRPAELNGILLAAMKWLAGEEGRAASMGVDSLKVMETPVLKGALNELGFAPVDFKFAFICDNLDPTLAAEAIAPERWYLMPID